jgi:lipopolysaccharide transport system permease protein
MKEKYYTYNFFKTIGVVGSNIRDRFELLKQMVYINLTSQFKKTFLGNSWIIVDPIISILIWLLLHTAGVFSPGETDIPYPAYVLLSMSIWTFFIGFFNGIGTSVSESGRMLIEVSFPMEIKVLEKVIINCINFMIPVLINIIVLIFLGVEFSATSLLFIPALIPLMLLGIALGMFFSLIEVVFNDIFLFFKKGITLLMYVTPIIYSDNVNSVLLQKIIKYNPLNYLITIPRNLLIGSEITTYKFYLISSVFAIIVFILVFQFYFISVKKIIEKVLE